MILTSLDLPVREFEEATGWALKPEGACRDEVCVPMPGDGTFDLVTTADRLRMALVRDESADLWALGPASLGDRALLSAQAPDLLLDDLDGRPFALSSLLRKKVLLVSWAPY